MIHALFLRTRGALDLDGRALDLRRSSTCRLGAVSADAEVPVRQRNAVLLGEGKLLLIFSVLPKSLRLICHAEREPRSGNKNVARPYSKNSRGSDLFPDNFTK